MLTMRIPSKPTRPGHVASGELQAIPMYACRPDIASERNTVSTSRIPFRSIAAAFFLCSLVRRARKAAKAVPS